MPRRYFHARIATPMLCLLALSTVAEERTPGLKDTAELALVLASGNTDNTTVSLRNVLTYDWAKASFSLTGSILRAESGTRVLSNDGGNVEETTVDQTTAEMYALGARYKRDLGARLSWYGGADWLRNRFTGIDDRWTLGGGLGYQVTKTAKSALNAELGANWVSEEQSNGTKAEFGDARAFLGYTYAFSDTAKLEAQAEAFENLSDSDDLRVNGLVGISANLTSRTALKVS